MAKKVPKGIWLIVAAAVAVAIFMYEADTTAIPAGIADQVSVEVHPMTLQKIQDNYEPATTGCMYGTTTDDTYLVSEAFFDGGCSGLNALATLSMRDVGACEFSQEEFAELNDGYDLVGVMCDANTIRFYNKNGFVGETV